MLESKVVDGSLHMLESIPGFRLQDQLKHHTKFDKGLYSVTFFVGVNQGVWDKLSEEDRKAIESVSGEKFAELFGDVFNKKNQAAEEELKSANHVFNTPDADLLAKITEIRTGMIADWEKAAKESGVADPMALLADYEAAYAANKK